LPVGDNLAIIEEFRINRDVLLEKIVQLEAELVSQTERHQEEIAEMERQHVESKNR